MAILVGTCGFREAQQRVFRDLDMVEVQKTFYQPPKPETARRWRQRAGPGFAFAVKAWQLITHRSSSPTFRRLKEPLDGAQLQECGDFRWNATTRMAWQRTQDIADGLEAEAVVLQTPKSFAAEADNLDRLRLFLERADRRGRYLVFEPRGASWTPELIEDLAEDLGLVHGVDPFLGDTATPDRPYYRLHGRPAYNYRYQYTDSELDWLARLAEQSDQSRVLFNNDAMGEDARRLKQRLRS